MASEADSFATAAGEDSFAGNSAVEEAAAFAVGATSYREAHTAVNVEKEGREGDRSKSAASFVADLFNNS